MNREDHLQLTISPPFKGVLTITFKGQSSREDVDPFKKAIDAHLGLFSVADIKNVSSLVAKLKARSDDPSRYLFDRLSRNATGLLSAPGPSIQKIVAELNRIITGPPDSLYEDSKACGASPFAAILPSEAENLLRKNPTGPELVLLNRLLLEAAFPQEIAENPHFQPKVNIRQIIFDLSEIDPIMNAAGRLLDLACLYHETMKLSVQVRLPADIYEALHEITPDEVKRPPPVKRTRVRGVTVVVTPARGMEAPDAWADSIATPGFIREPITVLSCVGKVRAVSGSVVSVSLFVDGEEVIGEFDRSQFPKGQVVPGRVFDYQAIVTAPGKTEISIDFLTEQQATDEELVDGADEVMKEIPLEKI